MQRRNENPSWQTVYILWGALLGSTFIYIGLILLGDVVPAGATPDPIMLPAIGVAALISAGVGTWLPRHFLNIGLKNADIATEEVPDPNASVMFRDKTPTIRVFADPPGARRAILTRYFTPFILGMALAESVAIYGLVLALQGFALTHWIGFFAVSWALMLYRFPRKGALWARAEKLTGARFPEG